MNPCRLSFRLRMARIKRKTDRDWLMIEAWDAAERLAILDPRWMVVM